MNFDADSWQVREVMPYDRYDDVNQVTWNKVISDRKLADPVPELGTPRLVDSRFVENSATFERFGIAYHMQHGFMNTAEGVRMLNMHL